MAFRREPAKCWPTFQSPPWRHRNSKIDLMSDFSGKIAHESNCIKRACFANMRRSWEFSPAHAT